MGSTEPPRGARGGRRRRRGAVRRPQRRRRRRADDHDRRHDHDDHRGRQAMAEAGQAEKPRSRSRSPQVPTIEVKGGQPVGGVQELEFEAGGRDPASGSPPTSRRRVPPPRLRRRAGGRRGRRDHLRRAGRHRGRVRARGPRHAAPIAEITVSPADASGRRLSRRHAVAAAALAGVATALVAFPAAAAAHAAGRQAGPADPGVAVRLGGVAGPDRLLLRAHARLAEPRFEEDDWRPLATGSRGRSSPGHAGARRRPRRLPAGASSSTPASRGPSRPTATSPSPSSSSPSGWAWSWSRLCSATSSGPSTRGGRSPAGGGGCSR